MDANRKSALIACICDLSRSSYTDLSRRVKLAYAEHICNESAHLLANGVSRVSGFFQTEGSAGMKKIEFDAIADIKLRTLQKRMKTFQPFYLSNMGGYDNYWSIHPNKDRYESGHETHDLILGDVEAVAFRRHSRMIISVTTSSAEFAHKFAAWLIDYCGAMLLADLPPVLPTPTKKIGRKPLECNEWAYQQRKKGRSYDDILEEFKERFYKETGEDPDLALANPRNSIRQAVCARREKAR